MAFVMHMCRPASTQALLVVVGHPVLLMEDASWRELLKFCAVSAPRCGRMLDDRRLRHDSIALPSLDGMCKDGKNP